MNLGWSIKEAGAVLGIHPKKIPQAIGPAKRKIAKLMLADPLRTFAMLYEEMELIDLEHAKEETETLEAMGELRIDRKRIFPRAQAVGR